MIEHCRGEKTKGPGLQLIGIVLMGLLVLTAQSTSASCGLRDWLRPSSWPVFVDVSDPSGRPAWSRIPSAHGRLLVIRCARCSLEEEDWAHLGQFES